MRVETRRKRNETLLKIDKLIGKCDCEGNKAQDDCGNCKLIFILGKTLITSVEMRKKAPGSDEKWVEPKREKKIPDHFWSEEKTQMVINYHKDMTRQQLAAYVGVTKNALDAKLCRMGLKSKQVVGKKYHYYEEGEYICTGDIKSIAKQTGHKYDYIFRITRTNGKKMNRTLVEVEG